MDVVMFCHPTFLASQSMPRFAQLLKTSFEARGHRVEVWSPRPILYDRLRRLGLHWGRPSKWAGYIDQYILFPAWVRAALKRTSERTLFVFCDQALGPWVPLVADRPHVVHVHDLLALRSALGSVPENPTSITGRIYQRYIRRGFSQARHFISISGKTREDLHRFGKVAPLTSAVVYHGMNYPYSPLPLASAQSVLRAAGFTPGLQRPVLHVGGGQWYKNLPGVIAIYARYASQTANPRELWCVSPEPNAEVRAQLERVPTSARVRFFYNLESVTLQALYSFAAAFLFPSLAEGFGWPLLEAQACGCPVITTDEAPMNEVAGPAARYLPRLASSVDMAAWAAQGAVELQLLLDETASERQRRIDLAQAWVKGFDANKAADDYLAVYKAVLESEQHCRIGVRPLGQSRQI
jgi:glycosyltransferase involved in cell wall biosynthesis